MPFEAEAIAFSLAPGLALNGVILYSTSLQNRFVHTTGRVRDLNREARQLRGSADPLAVERIASLRAQVELLARRSRIIRRSILVMYASLLGLVLTILELLLLAAVDVPGLEAVALITFATALVAMGVAVWLSWSETYFSQTTILEDIRTSYASDSAPDTGE